MKVTIFVLFLAIFISTSFCANKASISTSTSRAALPIPVAGLVNLPVTYLGVVTNTVSGLLGSLLPAISLIANVGVGNILTLGTSVITANGLSTTGATVAINITLPACGLLQVVADTGLLTPVISLVSDVTNLVNSLLSGLLGTVTADLSLGNNLGIWCQAAPGCTVSLTVIALNGIVVSEDLNVNGNSLNNVLSVLITNDLLSTCNFQITANLQVNCGVTALVDNITQCNFLFGLLNDVTGGGLLGGLLKK